MLKKSKLSIALFPLLFAVNAHSATLYENQHGDTIKVYGEVGVGGHIGANNEYGEFYTDDKTYIDDSFATIGIKGNYDKTYYRLELDFERENWEYGSGDMVLSIDKVFVGYMFLENHAIEFGITDTALDDYDKFGDYTFDTTVETGEAGDQANTLKYEGTISDFAIGVSYSYNGESASGSALGDVINGYLAYYSDYIDIAIGAETRTGSEGESKYGQQFLFAAGLRAHFTEQLSIGLNGYVENEDIAQSSTLISIDSDLESVYSYNDYETLQNKGGLISARFKYTPQVHFTASANFEAYEEWDIESEYGPSPDDEYSWGKERTWTTLGIIYKPSRSVVYAFEANFGEAAQDAYAYARVYF